MKRKILVTALLGVMIFMAGCIGPMNATSRVKTWNREIENRWGGELVYVLFSIPYGGVYGVLFLSDVILWNSIDFWGGENPIDRVDPARIQALRELDKERHGP
jgi:hypothetical protein